MVKLCYLFFFFRGPEPGSLLVPNMWSVLGRHTRGNQTLSLGSGFCSCHGALSWHMFMLLHHLGAFWVSHKWFISLSMYEKYSTVTEGPACTKNILMQNLQINLINKKDWNENIHQHILKCIMVHHIKVSNSWKIRSKMWSSHPDAITNQTDHVYLMRAQLTFDRMKLIAKFRGSELDLIGI